MSAVVLDLVITGLVAAVAIVVGWWIRGSGAGRMATSDGATDEDVEAELARARRMIPVLQDLAVRISTDVDAHSHRVEEINRDLTSEHDDQASVVVDAVANLLESNREMQQQLASAKDKLQEQAREVKSHAQAARTDALTQLANRRAFDDELARGEAQFRAGGATTSLVMIDVDHFKRFNDTHGHQAGDEVLQGVARVLRQSLREADFVARYGGEEFAIIQPGGLTAENEAHVEKVREAIEKARFRFGDANLQVTASFGLAQLNAGEDIASLIQRSDTALYAAKQAGRNRVCVHDGRLTRPLCKAKVVDTSADQSVNVAVPPKASEAAPSVRPESTKLAPKRSPSRNEQHWPAEAAKVPDDRICNRTAFCNALGRQLSDWKHDGPTPCVLLVQVDDYPGIISRHGHRAGNPVLDVTARFLVAALREMDIIADYDLATYAILLPDTERSQMVMIAERLRKGIAAFTLRRDEGPLRFTVSVGGSEPVAGDSIQTHLQRIEGALRKLAAAGGNDGNYYDGTSFQPAGQVLEMEVS